jgi:hypothetical protein
MLLVPKETLGFPAHIMVQGCIGGLKALSNARVEHPWFLLTTIQ